VAITIQPPRRPETPQTAQSTTPAKIDSSALESLPWKKYSNGGGEWAFYMDRDENLLPELASERPRRNREAEGGRGVDRGELHLPNQGQFLKRFQAHGEKQ
jgi:hypothetical protein